MKIGIAFRFIACFAVLVLSAMPHDAQAMETKAKQAIVIDDTTNTVLLTQNADEKMAPSSMSKLMTVYIVFKRLKEGSLKLTDELAVSEKAWRMQGSKMFVKVGDYVKVGDLLQGIIIQSGNDACIVVAEGLAGSEEAFAEVMNKTAADLGLKSSHFTNATGWPDEQHYMTARDLAVLAHHLIHDFPDYYPIFAEKEFTYNGIHQPNRNLLLDGKLGVDGLKTGHTEAAGYGLVSSAKNESGRRIIAVVNGLTSNQERLAEAERLLAHGFRDFENRPVVRAGQMVGEVDVWMGERTKVPVTAKDELILTLPLVDRDKTRFVLSYAGPAVAPVAKGAQLAELKVTAPGQEPQIVPLFAAEDVYKLGAFQRIIPAASYYLLGR